MKENKTRGFTLIELLAIIVILAIIAVITVPIILNIIENSRKGAAVDSAYGYKDAIEKYYLTELSKDSDFDLDGEYTIGTKGELVGNVDENGITPSKHLIQISGTIPSEGSISIENNVVKTACLVVDEYKVKLQDGKFTTSGKGGCSNTTDNPSDEPTNPEPYIYRNSTEVVSIGDSMETIESYETDLSEITKNYYLKHEVVNDIITKSYACKKDDGKEVACVQGGDGGDSYSENQAILQNLQDNGWVCNFSDEDSYCFDSSIGLTVTYGGTVIADAGGFGCSVVSNGDSSCG